MSVSSPHAAAWLSVIPPPRLNLHQSLWNSKRPYSGGLAWVSPRSTAVHTAQLILWIPWVTMLLTCKHGGDVVTRHNRLRDAFVESCRRACIGVQVEVGGKYGLEERRKLPADVLATNWMLGKPAAFDFTIDHVSASYPKRSSVTAGSAAFVAEERKHRAQTQPSI